jgi:uncharacterized C2H2 Zn-finger protein
MAKDKVRCPYCTATRRNDAAMDRHIRKEHGEKLGYTKKSK